MKWAAGLADQLASIAERLPMPSAGRLGERAVEAVNGALSVRHPVSGGRLDEAAVSDVISNVVHDPDTPKERFLALRRLLPERLEEKFGGWMIRLPADTRLPDHTLLSRKRSPADKGIETQHQLDVGEGVFGQSKTEPRHLGG